MSESFVRTAVSAVGVAARRAERLDDRMREMGQLGQLRWSPPEPVWTYEEEWTLVALAEGVPIQQLLRVEDLGARLPALTMLASRRALIAQGERIVITNLGFSEAARIAERPDFSLTELPSQRGRTHGAQARATECPRSAAPVAPAPSAGPAPPPAGGATREPGRREATR